MISFFFAESSSLFHFLNFEFYCLHHHFVSFLLFILVFIILIFFHIFATLSSNTILKLKRFFMKLLDYIYNCDDWNEIETNLQLCTFLLTTDQFDFNCDISSLRKFGIYCISDYRTIEYNIIMCNK